LVDSRSQRSKKGDKRPISRVWVFGEVHGENAGLEGFLEDRKRKTAEGGVKRRNNVL